jgi:hypothetical protein
MLHRSQCLITVISSVLLSTLVHAQAFETNGLNAALRVQGVTASVEDPVAHDVAIPIPGTFFFDVTSGGNPGMGVILLASSVNPVGPQFLTPFWGGSIDVGSFLPGPSSIQVVADGIALSINPAIDINYRTSVPGVTGGPIPTYTQSVTLGNSVLCGFRAAIQCIVQDPTNSPIFIDNTEAADCNFEFGQELTLLTGDDGVVNVQLLPGNSFPFHGVSYTDLWVCGNGLISFGGPTNFSGNGFTVDAAGWSTAQPSIAVCMSDWAPGNTGAQDGVFYKEIADRSNGGFDALISWGDTRGLPSGAPGMVGFFGVGGTGILNRFEAVLSGQSSTSACTGVAATVGEFRLRWPLLDPANSLRPGDGIFGHTPGSPIVSAFNPPRSNDLLGQVVSTGAGAPSVEEHDNNGLNLSVLGTGPTRTPRLYNNFYAATGMEVTFAPNAGTGIAGSTGYTSTPVGLPADDVEGILGGTVLAVAGTPITIVGKFFGFGTGTVTFVDSAGATFPGVTGSVISGTGPLFSNEGLVVTVPALAVGNATITVNFGSGYTESIGGLVISPCQIFRPLLQGDDTFVAVPLTSSTAITLYGVAYGQMFVGSNGIITMGVGSTDFTSTFNEMMTGLGTSGNAAVAPLWVDLNFGGTASGATYLVLEDPCNGTIDVTYTNQAYWNTGAPAGTFSVRFGSSGPDSIRFDYSQLLNDPGNGDTAIVGVSDGLFGPGFVKTDFATLGGIETQIPGYSSAAPQESVAEDMPTGTVATRLQTINGTGIFTIQNTAGILTIF